MKRHWDELNLAANLSKKARPPQRIIVAIALANEMARTIWAMLTRKEAFRVSVQTMAAWIRKRGE